MESFCNCAKLREIHNFRCHPRSHISRSGSLHIRSANPARFEVTNILERALICPRDIWDGCIVSFHFRKQGIYEQQKMTKM